MESAVERNPKNVGPSTKLCISNKDLYSSENKDSFANQ